MVALAYALHVQNAPVVPTNQELHQQVDVDYEALLTVIVDSVSVRLDDPLKNGCCPRQLALHVGHPARTWQFQTISWSVTSGQWRI